MGIINTITQTTMHADPAVSQRLQRAAEQLQDAIQSARRKQKAQCEKGESHRGKVWQLEPTVRQGPKLEECEEVSDEGSDAIPCQPQQVSDNDVILIDTSLVSDTVPQSPTKRDTALNIREDMHGGLGKENLVEGDMSKTLAWKQQHVEMQAGENQAVRETLARAIYDMTDIIVDFVTREEADVLVRTAVAAIGISPEMDFDVAMLQLAPDKVVELVDLWDDALVTWREQNLAEKQQLVGRFAHFEEECLVRMRAGEVSHRLERERLVLEANQQQMQDEDDSSRLTQQLQSAHESIETLQMQITDLKSQISKTAATNVQLTMCEASTETDRNEFKDENLQQQILDLTARVKSSELYALRCEAALEEQTQRANKIENRLRMQLEEYQARDFQRQSLRSIVEPSEAVQVYRQKLELLEDRMQDIMQQVACDHEQFEYEQEKWALEKRHHREKYDEVLDASVKVLKVLIIREKLMKKSERTVKRQSADCQEKQLELAYQVATLQSMTNELMQQSAMVLLVLQQLAVRKANPGQPENAASTWTLPAKPVQMKVMIRRLKKIEAVLGGQDWAGCVNN